LSRRSRCAGRSWTLAEAAERAGEVTILVQEGREVAAIVPIEVVTN